MVLFPHICRKQPNDLFIDKSDTDVGTPLAARNPLLAFAGIPGIHSPLKIQLLFQLVP